MKFKKCQHPVYTKEEKRRKAWLKEDSNAYVALVAVVKKNNFSYTGNIEVFHSLCNNYCPKRLHFICYGAIARSQLAILDYNSDIGLKQIKQKMTEAVSN